MQEIKEETSSSNKLKNLLVLLMRCLALASLVFAFAQPFIPKDTTIKSGERSVSVFVDNSFSMKGEDQNVPLLEIAKQQARTIIQAYENDDKFQVLTNDFEGKHLRLVPKEEALGMIDEINISPSSKVMSQVIQRQKQTLKGNNQIAYVISDFQKSIAKFKPSTDSVVEVNFLPLQSSQSQNVSIDSVWFVSPVVMLHHINQLVVKMTNHGPNKAENIKTSLLLNGQEKPMGLHTLDGFQTITDTLDLQITKAGLTQAEVHITDYPIQFDDKYFIAFHVAEKVNVLAINAGSQNKYLNALFNGLPQFQFDNNDIGQIQFQKFKNYDLILLNDLPQLSSGFTNELIKYLDQGGKVLVFPSQTANVESYNGFLSQAGAFTMLKGEKVSKTVSEMNTNEFVFNDVYESKSANIQLPKTTASFQYNAVNRTTNEQLLGYRDGSPYLVKFQKGQGILYVCAAPLAVEFNDLTKIAEVFVPMLYKMSLAKSQAKPLAYTIGRSAVIDLEDKSQNNEMVYNIVGKTAFIPSQQKIGQKILINIKDQVTEAGHYLLKLKEATVDNLALNYDRLESTTAMASKSELEGAKVSGKFHLIEKGAQNALKETISHKERGIVLWKWFVIAALLFLLIEGLLLRFLK